MFTHYYFIQTHHSSFVGYPIETAAEFIQRNIHQVCTALHEKAMEKWLWCWECG
jgi:hypothetical protein